MNGDAEYDRGNRTEGDWFCTHGVVCRCVQQTVCNESQKLRSRLEQEVRE